MSVRTQFLNLLYYLRLLLMIVYLPIYFRPAPKNEDEMMIEIFAYIDRLMSVVRPRRLLYMAIDGVVITFS